MTRGLPGMIAIALVAVAGVVHVNAHHSIARFDGGRVVKVAGVVTRFRWTNPHASIELASSGSGGLGAGQWMVEMQAPSTMMDEGWRRDSLAAGDHVTLFVHPWREDDATADMHRALYVGAIMPGGATLGRVEGHAGTGGE